jgi:type I restriction enzyme, S subunit
MSQVQFKDLLAEPVRNGVYKPREFHGLGVRLVNMKELFAFDTLSDQPDSRIELTPKELAKAGLRDGDLLFARRSFVLAGAGKCSLVVDPPEALTFESSMIRARPNPERADSRFLFYYFKSPQGRARMASIAARTAVSGITGSNLSALEIEVPGVDAQRQIANVLKQFDDLIENNGRRVEVLEEMAQAIYREWFVRFRYPGHEDVPLVDSALGPIPEGWRVQPLEAIAKVNDSSRKPHADEVFNYLDISALSERGIGELDSIGGAEAPGRARRVVSPGDTVWATVRPNRRAHALAVEPGSDWIASTGLAVLTPKAVSPTFLFETTSTSAFSDWLVGRATGSAYPAVRAKDFEEAQVVVPDTGVESAFAQEVAPMHELSWKLRTESSALARLRDLLLPRLVTGQIAVSTVDLEGLSESSVA